MQTATRNEKGRRPGQTPTPMQTRRDSRAARVDVPTPVRTSDRPVRLCPRHRRLLLALLSGPQTREQLDREAGTSNAPDCVLKLRRRFGLALPCGFSPVIDRDGRTVERGTYSLAPADRDRIESLLLAHAQGVA